MAGKEPTGWVGWVSFASVMMMILGGFEIIAGLVAIFKNNYYLVTEHSLVVFNYTAWGWIHLILGIILIMAGGAVMRGAVWARMIGVLLAGLSLFANMAFLSAYPLWSILMIVVDILIIWSLTVHGGEMRE